MTIEKFSALGREKLAVIYDPSEAKSILSSLLMYVLNCDRIHLNKQMPDPLLPELEEKATTFLDRLLTGEPFQYIAGVTPFYGLTLKVNSDVLIPRPETEFLVDLIIRENQFSGLQILDICTGSGCIALALKKSFIQSRVTALDISEEALGVARENAVINNLSVDFIKHDILKLQNPFLAKEKFQLIVSNPPYVTESEKTSMHLNVVSFEPAIALFVPDEDPLLFYKAIEVMLDSLLDTGGKFFAEINEMQSNALLSYFNNKGYLEVSIRKDINGKDRYLILRK